MRTAEQSIDVAAPPEICFEAIVDYESFPRWQAAAKRVEVLERYEDGLGKVVKFVVDLKLREVSYRLRYHYDPPRRVWWDFIEGDLVRDLDGDYTFESDDELTRATYRVGIEPTIAVPGFIARRLNDEMMRRSVEDLKREAERRAADS